MVGTLINTPSHMPSIHRICHQTKPPTIYGIEEATLLEATTLTYFNFHLNSAFSVQTRGNTTPGQCPPLQGRMLCIGRNMNTLRRYNVSVKLLYAACTPIVKVNAKQRAYHDTGRDLRQFDSAGGIVSESCKLLTLRTPDLVYADDDGRLAFRTFLTYGDDCSNILLLKAGVSVQGQFTRWTMSRACLAGETPTKF